MDDAKYFLKPSGQNACITQDGKMVDIAPGQLIGVWNLKGQCIDVYPNLINSIFSRILLIQQKNQQMLLILSEKQIKIFDLKKKAIQSQFQIDNFFDDVIQNNQNQDQIIGINNGSIQIWSLNKQNIEKTINTNTKSRNITQLQNSQILIRNNDGEIFVNEQDQFKIINTMGHVFSFCKIEGSEFALGRNQSIQIIDAKQNAIKKILKGYDEIYTCIIYHEKNIISGSNIASIKIWSLKTFKCIQCIQNQSDVEYSNLLVHDNIILASNPEVKRVRIWKFGDFTKPLEQISCFDGDLINIQKLVELSDNHIGILCYAYYFENDFKIFLQEIRVYDLQSQNLIVKKQIDRGQFIVEPSSMKNVLDNKLLYCQNSISIQKSTLYVWDYKTDKEAVFEFNVEKPQNAIFYKFNRIVVPYCLSFMAGGDQGLYMKGPSGISIYDFQVNNPLLKINFDYDFNKHVVEMSDKNTLYFVNQKIQIEIWNVKKQCLIKKIECKPNQFQKIQIIQEYYFLQNQHNDLIIWDSQLNPKQRKRLDQNVVKILPFEKFVYILNLNGCLERFCVENGKQQKSILQYQIKDFTFQENKMIVCGETLIQSLISENIF